MNPNMFREYDIRGKVPDDLNSETVYELARSFGAYFKEKGTNRIALGRDCRISSPEFRDIVIKGVTKAGIDVIDVGMIPTPLLYFSLFHLDVDGGIQITASHNPSEYNGFKICFNKTTIYGDEIQRIWEIYSKGDFPKGGGKAEEIDIITPYVDHVSSIIKNYGVKRKVVVDGGNGMGGLVAPEIYRKMGVEVEELFCEPDGLFPNHHPDPTIPENLEVLISKVKETGADLGIGFDGDGDRLGVVDKEGRMIWGDQLLIIFSRDLLEREKGAKIIAEVKCSQVLFDDIKKQGGVPIMWKAGHSLIKGKMKEESALLAGEMSGHLFFSEGYFGYDDAVYAGARLLEILTRKETDVRSLLDGIPEMYNTPEIRLDCPDEKKFAVVEALVKEFKEEYEVIDIDGARVIFDRGWGLIRASNTQPVLVLRFESDSREKLEEIRKVFMDKLNKVMV